MLFYAMSAEEALKKLSSQPSGLSSSVAKQREKKYGPNVIKVESEPLWKKIIEPFIDVFTLVLVTAAAISLWHGATIDAFIILVIIAVSATIFYIQRFSTDRVLRSLSRHDTQKVDVMRGGKIVNLDAAQLVPGDIVNLTEGEKVPADIRLIKATNLRVDEAQLTGESIPISKHIKPLDDKKEIYEQANMLFQGSFVVSGTGTGVITATGNATEFGNIAALSKKETAKSPVQRKIDILITKIIATVAAVAVVAFGLSLLRGMDLFDSIRFVMALAVSAVPESLPIAISVVLVLGMRRMAAKKALVHQMRAIETVGVITTIATDKTGTLTKNILTVQEVWTLNPKNDIKKVIAYFANHGDGKSHDPLDMAINTYAKRHNASVRGLPTMELPFNQEAAMSATVWHYGKNYHTYYKGAPESIMNACRVPKVEAKRIAQALEELTSHGYRVVGLASSTSTEAPTGLSSLDPRTKMHFVGLIAVADVLRPEASRAIKSALAAGVSVRMITGDHFETAYQIGKKLGMVESREEVFDCRKMSDMTDEELDGIIEKTKVFSRVIPEQKFRILKILKKHNITTMTGDGVNDVPALSGADVGIAMGSGSSIAKDAGAIILLDDNFKTIIDAMKEGRTIIANVRRMLFYLLSTNTGELITMVGALLIGIKTPLEPVQILWVNLVTDTSMVIPIGLEPTEKGIMNRPPEKPNSPILSRTMIWRMVIVAGTMSTIALAVYIFFEQRQGHAYAQTMAFITLIVSQWANAFNARSDSESLIKRLKMMNKSFYAGISLSIILQALVFFGPLGEVLHITHVTASDMIIVSLISFIIPILTSECHKHFTRHTIH